MLLSNLNNGLVSVIHPGGIICHRVSVDDAREAIYSAVPDAPTVAVESLLTTPSDPARFRSAWASATAASLEAVGERLEDLEDSSEVDELRGELSKLAAAQQEFTRHLRDAEREAEERQLNKQRELLLQSLADMECISIEDSRLIFGAMVREVVR